MRIDFIAERKRELKLTNQMINNPEYQRLEGHGDSRIRAPM